MGTYKWYIMQVFYLLTALRSSSRCWGQVFFDDKG